MSLNHILAFLSAITLCIQSTIVLGAGLDSSAYVSQVSGMTSRAMSMKDLLAPVKNLAASLPHLPATQGNYALALQNGDYNNAAILQSGLHNAALIAQTGYQNSAFIQQFGSGHQGFVVQNGVGNFASITQR